MKEFEFNHAQQSWDRYKEFHTTGWDHPFVEFANGQLIITHLPNPRNRKMYDRYDIQLVTTTDPDVPRLYLNSEDENPIPKAWVQQGGQQYLAVDWEREVAVAIGYLWYKQGTPTHWTESVPDNINGASVYWSGPKRLPIALCGITVSTPDKGRNAEIQEKLREVIPALHAIERMKNPPIPRYLHGGKIDLKVEWLDLTTEQLVAELSRDDHTLKSVTRCGFNSLRVVQEVPYLYVKKGN
jgi:hypothetical protein